MGVRVVELFAGVGGFRLGLERRIPDSPFQTRWWNQWEPSTKTVQHAWRCYVKNLCGDDPDTAPEYSNTDICKVPTMEVPPHDLLVGGFPCQDYSVARTLDRNGGLRGKKGVLWWQIHRILKFRSPAYVLLENVDRLLKSPAGQRGRDFAVLLGCLRDLGYIAEWRVINAADYGNAQRRRRTFIFAAHKRTAIGRYMKRHAAQTNYLWSESFFAQEFPTSIAELEVGEAQPNGTLPRDVRDVSAEFSYQFQKAGVMVDGDFWTRDVLAAPEKAEFLKKHLEKGDVDSSYFLDPTTLEAWEKAKGPKKIPRTARNGYPYVYAEGGMKFPDLRRAPARTILTSEANRTPNRSTHVVHDIKTGKKRFLTPVECERLMGFDEGWTEGIPQRWRYFTMGNALVVPLVTRMGNRLVSWIEEKESLSRQRRLLGEIRGRGALSIESDETSPLVDTRASSAG